MKLTVLCDNHTVIDRYLLGEPALSIYIENGRDRILFDTGYSDVFIQNAMTLGIDLSHLSAIVISHGHNDHTGGLFHLLNRFDLSGTRLIAHPDIFQKRIYDGLDVGCPISRAFCKEKGLIITETRDPVKLSENLYYLGEIPRQTAFESRFPTGEIIGRGNRIPDYVMDDSALAYLSEEGPFVITGCSHSGICNILLAAVSLYDRRVKASGIIGGFHLLQESDPLEETVRFLKDHTCGTLYPCHCVSLRAKCRLMQELPVREIGTGEVIEVQ